MVLFGLFWGAVGLVYSVVVLPLEDNIYYNTSLTLFPSTHRERNRLSTQNEKPKLHTPKHNTEF